MPSASFPTFSPPSTHYATLNVSSTASTAEVMAAYEEISLSLSSSSSSSTTPSDDIKSAYITLVDPIARRTYDESLRFAAVSASLSASGYGDGKEAGGLPVGVAAGFGSGSGTGNTVIVGGMTGFRARKRTMTVVSIPGNMRVVGDVLGLGGAGSGSGSGFGAGVGEKDGGVGDEIGSGDRKANNDNADDRGKEESKKAESDATLGGEENGKIWA